MGVVFTTLFAAACCLLEQSDSAVHLDVEHALMGNLESLIWLDASGWGIARRPAARSPGCRPQLAGGARLVLAAMALFLRCSGAAEDLDIR